VLSALVALTPMVGAVASLVSVKAFASVAVRPALSVAEIGSTPGLELPPLPLQL